MKKSCFLILFFLATPFATAALHTELVQYKHGTAILQGYLAYDDAIPEKRPGVLVVHEWWGHNAFVRKKAEQLAQLGYTALAVDMYGKGFVTKDPKEAARQSDIYKSDRPLMRGRVDSGLRFLRQQKLTDPKKIAAIGFCFGGTTVLELARGGVELAGVVSFHGGLNTPNPDDAKNIKCKILVLHGGDDPYVPAAEVLAFQEEMRKARVDWQFVSYGGAVHAFMNPEAGHDNSKGAAYNEQAEQRAWEAMKLFLIEIFK